MSKITKFDSKTRQNTNNNKVAELKAYLGFEYVKLKKDVNGLEFSLPRLREFAKETRYIISVAREVKENVFVYNFFVENNSLDKFFRAIASGDIEGEIIDIDKLNSENLA